MISNLKIKYDAESLLKYGIVLTMPYASYSTFLYSFFGQTDLLRNLLIGLVLVIDGIAILMNLKKIALLIYLVLVFGGLFGFTYYFHPENQWVINSFLIDTIKYVMLAFLICIAKPKTIYESFKAGAFFILICCLSEPITHYVTAEANGYMVYGMRVLLPTVLFGYYYLQEHKKLYLLLMITGLLLILLFGNRSAILNAVLVFVFQLIFFGNKKNKVLRIFEIIIMVAMGFLLFSGNLLNLFGGILERFGMSSRTIELMTNGIETAMDDNGRSIIWENCRVAIAQKPWTGYGIGGERNLMLLGRRYESRLGGVYAHNIVYELLLDFGVIFGTLLIIFLVVMILRIILQKDKNPMIILFSAVVLSAIIKLLFSGSVWNEMDTYLCIGLGMGCFSNKMYKGFAYQKIND